MKIVILLGGNIGDTHALFEEAVLRLKESDFENFSCSSVYRSASWGYESENDYLNQVVTFDSDSDPIMILQKCLSIEEQLGRLRRETDGYADRPIDIDILYIDSLIIKDDQLQVPHPRLHLRKFTLAPLNEILPEFIHPILKNDHKSLLLLCPDKSKVEKV